MLNHNASTPLKHQVAAYALMVSLYLILLASFLVA